MPILLTKNNNMVTLVSYTINLFVFYTTGAVIEFDDLAFIFTFVPFAHPDIQTSKDCINDFF